MSGGPSFQRQFVAVGGSDSGLQFLFLMVFATLLSSRSRFEVRWADVDRNNPALCSGRGGIGDISIVFFMRE